MATGQPVEDHILRALLDYLDHEGHRLAVVGFGERARERHRVALDLLADP